MIYIVHNYEIEQETNDLLHQLRLLYHNIAEVHLTDYSAPGTGIIAQTWASGQAIMSIADMYADCVLTSNDLFIIMRQEDIVHQAIKNLNNVSDTQVNVCYYSNNKLFSNNNCELHLEDLIQYA